MTQHHVNISVTGEGRGEVTLDGQKIRGVQGVTFGARVDEMALLILDVAVPTGAIDGELVAILPEGTAETLIALGWTPPAGQTYGDSGRPKAWRHGCGEINEGDEPNVCGWCRFDASEHPDDITARYVLVEVPSEGVDDASPR